MPFIKGNAGRVVCLVRLAATAAGRVIIVEEQDLGVMEHSRVCMAILLLVRICNVIL